MLLPRTRFLALALLLTGCGLPRLAMIGPSTVYRRTSLPELAHVATPMPVSLPTEAYQAHRIQHLGSQLRRGGQPRTSVTRRHTRGLIQLRKGANNQRVVSNTQNQSTIPVAQDDEPVKILLLILGIGGLIGLLGVITLMVLFPHPVVLIIGSVLVLYVIWNIYQIVMYS